MLNFKSYKEAEEFHKSIYPIQTRKVLVEKHSTTILNREYNRFSKEIMYKPQMPIDEQEIILKNRKEYLSKILVSFNSHIKARSLEGEPQPFYLFHTPSSEYVIEEQEKNKHHQKDDLNSMWLDICELF